MWRYRRIVPGYAGPETLRPVTVVRDDEAGLVAWLAPETPVLRPVLPDGRELRSVPPVEMFGAERALRRDRWQGTGILKIASTGMPWSAWCFWNDDWSFRGWYVNLEDAHLRDEASIASQDHVLDLWIEGDRRVRWKDEDELEAAVIAGRYSAADADWFRADARAVEGIVQRWEPRFLMAGRIGDQIRPGRCCRLRRGGITAPLRMKCDRVRTYALRTGVSR